MNLDGVFNIAAAIVTLAMISVVVTSPNTAQVIRAIGTTFSSSIKAATLR